jgi:hypothetical protein
VRTTVVALLQSRWGGRTEIDAYLHQSFSLPPFQRDLLAHAANELIARIPPQQAPYVSDLAEGENAEED